MFRESRQLPKTLYAASALALVLGAGMVGDYVDFDMDIVPSAHAAQQAAGRGEKGAGPSGDVRGGGIKKGGSQGGRGGKSMKDVLAGEDDGEDSDRPAWVDQWKNTEDKKGGPPTTHRPGEKPRVPGSKMGDTYGDLWVLLRDPDGTPVLVSYPSLDANADGVVTIAEVADAGGTVTDTNADGVPDTIVSLPATFAATLCTGDSCFVQPLDASGNLIPLDAEGAPLVVYTDATGTTPVLDYSTATQEIDIGRSNVARSPTKVMDKSLVEALSKLDGATEITLDASGRLVVDGSAIDSPLENLALFKALIDAAVNPDGSLVIGDVVVRVTSTGEAGDTTYVFTWSSDQVLDLAASLLAAASDKTNVLTVDYVMAVAAFLGVDKDLSTLVAAYDYAGTETTYDKTVEVLVQTAPNVYEPATVNLITGAYTVIGTGATGTLDPLPITWNTIAATIDSTDADLLPDATLPSTGISEFTEAADDALQVLEYVHNNPVPE